MSTEKSVDNLISIEASSVVVEGGQILLEAVSDEAAPALVFTGDEDTGIYSAGSGVVGISSNSVPIAEFRPNQVNLRGTVTFPVGTSANPSIVGENDLSTGIYFPTTGALGISTSGTQKLGIASNIQATVPIQGVTGTALAPSFSFVSDPDSGMYNPVANQINWCTGGVSRMYLDATALWPNRVAVGAGTAGAPTISIQNGSGGMGVYASGSQQISISTNSTERFRVGNSSITGLVPFQSPVGSSSAPGVQIGSTTAGFYAGDNAYLNLVSNGIQRFRTPISRALTSGVAATLASMTWSTSGMACYQADYGVSCQNGTDYQQETGRVMLTLTNKAGVYAGTVAKAYSQQDVTGGSTLTVTFAISAANPAVLTVTSTSSLAGISTHLMDWTLSNLSLSGTNPSVTL